MLLCGCQVVRILISDSIHLKMHLPSSLQLVDHSSCRESRSLVYVLGQDGEREAQSWVKPCLGWFGSSWEPSVHTQPSAEQSDFLLFYWFGGQIGFNKRKENNFKASHPESTVICLQHSRTLKKGGSCKLEEIWGPWS